jgi:hypothetical protein
VPPMARAAHRRSLDHMKQRLFFLLVVTGLILLALGGWTVDGLRRFGIKPALV